MNTPLPNKILKSLCVFCASSSEVHHKYMDLAAQLGQELACSGIRLVYGGVQGGLMGAAADAALAAGGEVVGVIPEVLLPQERAHKGLTKLYVTPDMHSRQQKMAKLADGFIILPGGIGTLAEFFEILTWKHIGLHRKPIILINYQGFWDSLIALLNQSENERFLYAKLTDLLVIWESVDNIKEIQTFFASE
ncbi:MAG: TIGR00730 family Rossman fold protein [Rhodospirillales bacterium]|nr:TIGR00730 family Rossman fold protein [Rhodospirillales bacterium]